MVSHKLRTLLVVAVTLIVLGGLSPSTVQGQKFINFNTSGTVRATLVFTNQIVPDVYSFFANAGELLRVETSNAAFDTTLRVIGPDAAFNLFDDDGGVGLHSRIRFNAADTGAYIVVVSSFSGNPGGGTYDLTFARGAAAKTEIDPESGLGDYMPDVANPVEIKPHQ